MKLSLAREQVDNFFAKMKELGYAETETVELLNVKYFMPNNHGGEQE